jgi:glycosidase
MHYPVKDALIACFNYRENVSDFADKVEAMFKIYPPENIASMYVPLSSHDTERVLTLFGGNLDKLKLAYQFIFAYPGAPAIYYGDEVGMEGGKDPDNRRAFPWDPAHWKGDVRPWIQNLIATRKNRASLRRGDYTRVLLDDPTRLYAFARSLGAEKTLVVINASQDPVNASIPVQTLWREGQTLRSLLDSRPFTVTDGKLTISLPAWNGVYIG